MNHPTDEPQAGGLITWKWILIPVGIVTAIFIFNNFIWSPMVNGEKRWEIYTGTILGFEIDCEECCHPNSELLINTSNGVVHEFIGDCDESIEHLVCIGNFYTIRLEPYAEPYAITRKFGEPGSFWCVKIDWIKDVNGNVIYGNEWI